MDEKLFFYKIDPEGPGLYKQYPMDIGYDVKSAITITLFPGIVYKIPTNIQIKVPFGTYARIAERSSLALEGLSIKGGVIDPNYTGEVICLVTSLKEYTVKKNDKIAQLILEKVSNCECSELTLPPSPKDQRKDNGFGSTGK